MKTEISIIRSETWLRDDLDTIDRVLQEALDDFVDENDEIINIEKHTENDGCSRFWTYVKSTVE